MSAETDLIALLAAQPSLTGRVNGIFLNAADEAAPLPYVVITATHAPDLVLSGLVDTDQVSFTIAIWGRSAAMAEAIGDLVHAALDAADEYAVTGRTGGFDQQTGDDAAVITADRWT